MAIAFDTLTQQISALTISEQEKIDLLKQVKKVKKAYVRADFSLSRTLKDKSIVVNLLKKTIEDLQQQQAYVERSNQQLHQHKIEIEAKNTTLEKQKKLIEEHSQQLKQNLQELENSYHELEQFSYIASHDLKSPLRTIASYAQLLQRRHGSKLDGEADEFLNFIIKGVNHMNETICDLLEYSKAGKKGNNFVLIDLNNILDIVKFNLRQEIQDKEAKIISNNLPALYIQKSGMIQLFQNLIANAIKFHSDKKPIITINCEQKGNIWSFTVKDNGVGMNEDFQHKAFQPFQRLNNIERPGTGMGLAICKKITKMHDGDIHYTSKKGEGTTFHFTITSVTHNIPLITKLA